MLLVMLDQYFCQQIRLRRACNANDEVPCCTEPVSDPLRTMGFELKESVLCSEELVTSFVVCS